MVLLSNGKPGYGNNPLRPHNTNSDNGGEGFALSENLYYNDYVFDEQKGRMTDMKKAIIVLLTAAVAAGITLTAAGLPVSKAYADVATPGNLVTEESDTGGEEETIKPDNPTPTPVKSVTVTLTAEKDTIKLGEKVAVNPSISAVSFFVANPTDIITELTYDIDKPNDPTYKIFTAKSGDRLATAYVFGNKPGSNSLIAKWKYTDSSITGNTEAKIKITVLDEVYNPDNPTPTPEPTPAPDPDPKPVASSGSGGFSIGSSSRSSEPARAKAPSMAVTPVETDGRGISRFQGCIIAMPPTFYSEQDLEGLISSGKWTITANDYWQLNTPDAGTLRDCWALVSDTLSRNPTGNASWYYFNSYGYMVTGWQEIGGKYYYFNEEERSLYGALLMDGVTPDGNVVDETGARR